MAAVLPGNSEKHVLTQDEAKEFFEQAVRERLDISATEFLKNPDAYKQNPNYEFLAFLMPLVDASK